MTNHQWCFVNAFCLCVQDSLIRLMVKCAVLVVLWCVTCWQLFGVLHAVGCFVCLCCQLFGVLHAVSCLVCYTLSLFATIWLQRVTCFLQIVVEVKASGHPIVLKLWLAVSKGMAPVKYFRSNKSFCVCLIYLRS